MRKTPQKMSKSSPSTPHQDVQYHRMTAQNDGFVDMQVRYTNNLPNYFYFKIY